METFHPDIESTFQTNLPVLGLQLQGVSLQTSILVIVFLSRRVNFTTVKVSVSTGVDLVGSQKL